MKSDSLRAGGLWPRVWLLGATVFLSAVLGHLEHASRQAEFLGEAALIGLFLAFFLPWMFQKHGRGVLLIVSALFTTAAVLVPVSASVFTGCMARWEAKNLPTETVIREELFSNRHVMILVAHPDDEVLMLGGVIEEYVASGSEITLVYGTNGDHFGKGETRLREALSVAASYGIPEKNVIFLGYGDGWQGYQSPVQAPENELLTSSIGNTAAVGLPEHPAWREGTVYSCAAYRESIASLLRERQPDVIFCQDADAQFDHRTVSFLFEAALGEILRELPDYEPTVYKGFTYASSWTGDSFVPNTVTAPESFERMPDNTQYRQKDAVRFPVSTASVSPVSPELTALDDALEIYTSQDASLRSDQVMRSERVVFPRRTDSVLYDADITVSSGTAEELTDFAVSYAKESFTLLSPEMNENGWFPAPDDIVRTVMVKLCKPMMLTSVVLYDNPSGTSNILSATLTTDTGESYTIDSIDPLGGATEIPLELSKPISGFAITVNAWEGDAPGLAELEAFAAEAEPLPLWKLTDENGDFAYKCLTDETGSLRLGVYRSGTGETDIRLETDNESITLTEEADGVTVICPAGESGIVRLLSDDGELLDAVAVASPDGLAAKLLPCADGIIHLSLRGQYRYYRSLWHTAETLLRGYTV